MSATTPPPVSAAEYKRRSAAAQALYSAAAVLDIYTPHSTAAINLQQLADKIIRGEVTRP